MRCTRVAIPVGMTLLVSCTTLPPEPPAPDYVDMAEVIQAEPLYQPVRVARPVSECWIEQVPQTRRGHAAYGAPLVGGLIGGVLGNRLASGRGRLPMTVVGAALGAAVGHDLNAPPYRSAGYANVRRCRTVNHYEARQQLVGYRVDYRYEGQTFTTRTARHPGRFIRVRVDVDPADGT